MIIPNIPLVCAFRYSASDGAYQFGFTPVLYIEDRCLMVMGHDGDGIPSVVKLKTFIEQTAPTHSMVVPVIDGLLQAIDDAYDHLDTIANGSETTD